MNADGIKLAVIGATGLVGRTMLEVLEEQAVEIEELIPVASARSRGSTLKFSGRAWQISTLEDGLWREAHASLLSAGGKVAREWIPQLAKVGVTCIDNSSAFRQEDDVPLVVPEVNFDAVRPDHRIIANPNCSTIQLVAALAPLHKAFGLQEVVVSTYQSASGAGQRGKNALLAEREGKNGDSSPFPHRLADNLIPAIGPIDKDGACFEEWKMVQETRKILQLPALKVFVTTVRVPTLHCHGETVHATFTRNVREEEAKQILAGTPGLAVVDNPARGEYPLPLDHIGRDEVFIGRIRQAEGERKTLDFWVVADNLRKGAASNAVQILKLLIKNRYISVP
jgi:aspartate-semialdehyde dehydrogenase